MSAKAGPVTMLAGAPTAAKPADDDGEFIRTLGVDEQARALEEGERFAASGDYEGARLKFADAWTVWRLPSVLLRLAVAEERCGRFIDALKSYGELKELTDPASDYVRSLASYDSYDPEAIDAMRIHADLSLARLVERVGQLEVDHPPGATVSIDGHLVANLDEQPIWVRAGVHRVSATLGDATESMSVECVAGSRKVVTVLGGSARKQPRPE